MAQGRLRDDDGVLPPFMPVQAVKESRGLANQDSGSGFAGIKLGRGACLRAEVSRIQYRLYKISDSA